MRQAHADERQSMTGLPIELHLHLEGSIEPSLLSGILAGRGASERVDIEAMYAFSDFPGFLDSFRRVITQLTRPEDFRSVAAATCRKLKSIGVCYAEMIFTPLIHVRRGLDHKKVIRNLVTALEESEQTGGPRVRLIYDTVRQWGAEAAVESARIAVADMKAGLPVVGFGVGGDELSVPAMELREAFLLAKIAGLKSYVHAGEVGGPDSVWDALEVLGADRIGHGIAAAKDPLLMNILIERGVTLDCCPTSNLRTGAVESLEQHPLQKFLSLGVPVTLGSDDPGFFGSWLDSELETCIRQWGWRTPVIQMLTLNAVRASFLPQKEKEALLLQLLPHLA